MPSDSKKIKLGGRAQEAAFPSAGKNTWELLVTSRTWQCFPTTISGGVDISEIPGCYLLRQMCSKWMRDSRIGASWTYSLRFCFWPILTHEKAILAKECKLDNFESHGSLKLSLSYINGLRWNFDEKETFLESNSPDILALYETNLDDSRGYLPSSFNTTGFCYSFICMVSQFMWKKGFLLHWTISKKSVNSYLSFQLALLHSVSCLFFLCRSTSSSSCTHSFWCYFI